MKKGIRKDRAGQPSFSEYLIRYAIEGGVLARCQDHHSSIYRAKQDITPAHTVVETAWQKGHISSDLKPAIDQMDRLIEKAPDCCSQIQCWSKR